MRIFFGVLSLWNNDPFHFAKGSPQTLSYTKTACSLWIKQEHNNLPYILQSIRHRVIEKEPHLSHSQEDAKVFI